MKCGEMCKQDQTFMFILLFMFGNLNKFNNLDFYTIQT